MIANDEEIKEYFENLTSVKDSRKLFPVTENCIYLDSAHYSQYSLETKRRLNQFIHDFTFTNVNLTLENYRNSNILKHKAAELINADRDEIIITSSTTHGLNIFANGIQLSPGDTVAYADSEFPAIVYPWMNQEKLRGIKNVKIPSDNGKISILDIEKCLKENSVKVLTISTVEFLGFRNDMNAIENICKKYGCKLVADGIQSIGVIPFDVQTTKVDFLAAGSQKWMMAPSGIGFAYLPKRNREIISPTYVGTSSVKFDFKNFLEYKLDFADDGCAYENSTLNCLGMIGLISSIELFLKLGVQNIFEHIIKLLDVFIDNVNLNKYKIESSLEPVHRSNILIFTHADKQKNEEIQAILAEKKIFIALREGYLRISPHIFNNEVEMLKLVEALEEF